jgi:hypothetical protein
MEMLRGTTGWSWNEIERMSDASGRGSHTIAEMRAYPDKRELDER